MNKFTMNRRNFLQSALYSGLVYGTGSLPGLVNTGLAAPAPITNRTLINLNLRGGPDLRHLIVPAYDANPDSFGNKYWKHRWRAHRLDQTDQSTWQARWNNDYFPITVGGENWNNNLIDVGGLNSTNSGQGAVTFGIWREAGWLIDMFRAGHAALVFNAVGGTNRAHDLSELMLDQGNVLSKLNDRDRSGWGGRVARSAGGNVISLTNTPSPFCFGPLGDAPIYNPDRIDNIDLVSVDESRDFNGNPGIGLYDVNIANNQLYNNRYKLARSAKSYYAALRQEQVSSAYQKFMDHERKVRQFGELIQSRLESVPIPYLIEALNRGVNDPNGAPINPDPEEPTEARRVLRSSNGFARQILNLYDTLAANDLLEARVMSMSYGGWDSHGNQRRIPAELATDPNNPFENRGIESGLRDIFGGQFGNNPSDANALHCGFSALWASLPDVNQRQNLVLTIAGEFGRQIRDNGDAGTDHGKGNLMLILSESVQGGIYGEMFQVDEIDKYDNTDLRTPDIDPRTEIDQFFSQVADWVVPGSATSVFPRMASGFSGDAPQIELPGLFSGMFS